MISMRRHKNMLENVTRLGKNKDAKIRKMGKTKNPDQWPVVWETVLLPNFLYYLPYKCCVENMLPNMGKEYGVGLYHRVSRRICRLPFRLLFRTLQLYFNLYFSFWSWKKDLAFTQFKQCYLVGRFQHVEVILQNHKRCLNSVFSGYFDLVEIKFWISFDQRFKVRQHLKNEPHWAGFTEQVFGLVQTVRPGRLFRKFLVKNTDFF